MSMDIDNWHNEIIDTMLRFVSKILEYQIISWQPLTKYRSVITPDTPESPSSLTMVSLQHLLQYSKLGDSWERIRDIDLSISEEDCLNVALPNWFLSLHAG